MTFTADGLQRVDAAEVGGTGCPDHGHWNQAFRARLVQCLTQGYRVHAATLIHGDRHDGVVAEAEQGTGLLQAEMADAGGEDAQAPGFRRQAVGLVAGVVGQLLADRVTRQQQRHQVGLGAAAGEDAVGGRTQAQTFGGPVDQTLLDQGAAGALIPGIEGGIDRAEQAFRPDTRQHDRAVEVCDVARVMEIDGILQVERLELLQARFQILEGRLEIQLGKGRAQGFRGDAAEGLLNVLELFGDQTADALHAGLPSIHVGR